MNGDGGCRLQVCGPMSACLHGVDVTALIPAGQARVLFVYLIVHREVEHPRSHLIEALWPGKPPERAERDVTSLLSRLRAVAGVDVLPPGPIVRFVLPTTAEVDLEVAYSSIDRAERAVAAGDWPTAWASGRSAMAIARRGFLPEIAAPWAERERERLRDVLLRAYDAVGEAGLGFGGPDVLTTRQLAAEIIAEEPWRESGYRLAMRAAMAHGDDAEAVHVYARLRQRLADDLGVDPGPQSRALFEQLLAGSPTDRS